MTPDLSGWIRFVGLLAAEGLLLVAAGALTARYTRGAQLRRAVWQAVLVAVALAWFGEFSGVRGKLRLLAITAQPAASSSPENQPGGPRAHGYWKWLVEMGPRTADAPISLRGDASRQSVTWLAWIWLMGTAALLLRAISTRAWLAVQRRQMTEAAPETLASASQLRHKLGLRRLEVRVWLGLRGPIAFGVFRPTAALPADFETGFSAEEREAMLAHELAHLAAHDPFWLALSEVVRACGWWHPAIWHAARKLRDASEAAADEASALVPEGRTALAGALARLGREWTTSGVARGLGMTGSGFRSELGRRVSALLEASGPWREMQVAGRWLPRIGAVALVAVFITVPVRTGLSGVALLAALGQANPGVNQPQAAAPAATLVGGPATNSDTQSSTFVVRRVTGVGEAGLDTNELGRLLTRMATPAPAPAAGGSVPTTNVPVVTLSCRLVELGDGQTEEIGLDWLFGQSPTNGFELQNGFPTNYFQRAQVSPAENFRINYWRTEGQSLVLSQPQFTSLLRRLEQRTEVDVLATPRVKTFSGRQAHVSVGDVVTVVTGVETANGSPANQFQAKINYATHMFPFGPEVDLLPTAEPWKWPEPPRWRLAVLAALNEFLGYDKPGAGQEVSAVSGDPGKPVIGVKPLPHFFTAETMTTASLRDGETLVLRGPRYPASEGDRKNPASHASRSPKANGRSVRLYVFVTLADDRLGTH